MSPAALSAGRRARRASGWAVVSARRGHDAAVRAGGQQTDQARVSREALVAALAAQRAAVATLKAMTEVHRVTSQGYRAAGLIILDCDGPLMPIDWAIGLFFREMIPDATEASERYLQWQARHAVAVAEHPETAKEDIFLELIRESTKSGGELEGLDAQRMTAMAGQLFYSKLIETLRTAGNAVHARTNGSECLVIAANSCGFGPPLQAALASLRGEPGLHVLVHANKAVYDAQEGWVSVGALVDSQDKGEWAQRTQLVLTDHFGLPPGNVVAYGDSARDVDMFVATLRAKGRVRIVDIGVPGSPESIKREIAKHEAGQGGNVSVVTGLDEQTGKDTLAHRMATGVPGIADQILADASRFVAALKTATPQAFGHGRAAASDGTMSL